MASTLTGASPCSASSATTCPSRSTESASRQRSSLSGKWLADVAQAGGAQQRVHDRVGEHVGVGVAQQPAVVVDLHPAEHQATAVDEHVAVVALADHEAPIGSIRRVRPSNTHSSLTPSPSSTSSAWS